MQQLIKSLLGKRGLLSCLSIGVTLLLLLMPSNASSGAMLFPHFDKIAHIAVFGACAFFLYIDCRLGDKPQSKSFKVQALIFIIGLVIGYVVELIQGAYLGREYSLQDIVADAVGLPLGLLFAKMSYQFIHRNFLV